MKQIKLCEGDVKTILSNLDNIEKMNDVLFEVEGTPHYACDEILLCIRKIKEIVKGE